ncbi:ABC transporter substrate-binding protein [Haliangium sp.]|uniref:ABC transporter substrate-binding protein n=1 Tax=Haliangium sp. TaxID=2663208 RepID=UPI003D0E5B8A
MVVALADVDSAGDSCCHGAAPAGARRSYMHLRVLTCAAIGIVAACGQAPRAGSPWLGDTHARDQAAGAAEAEPEVSSQALVSALDEGLDEGRPARAAVLANRLWARGATLTPAQRAAVVTAVDDIPAAELEAVWGELDPTRAPAAEVALRLALWHAHLGADEAAAAWLARAREAVDAGAAAGEPAPLAERAEALAAAWQEAAQAPVDPALVAVLLPLSGRYERLGRELAAAIEVAAAGAGVRWLVVDTGGDEGRAIAAVEQAAAAGAVAALGPVGARTARAAAARAAELGLPIALLAPADGADGGADPGAGVFRLWAPTAWEAGAAAALAVALGHTRLAVLSPRDEVGRRMASTFAEVARARGAEIVRAGEYDPTGTELEPALEAFLGLDPATNPRLRRHLQRHGRREGRKSFTPEVPFELLYIPDEHERAALVASFLPYFNVELRTREFMDAVLLRRKHRGRVPQVVQLLGSSGWHHAGLSAHGGPAVEGALVVDVFAGDGGGDYLDPAALAFAERFEAHTGRAPGRMAAQAHDAAALILAALAETRGPAPRAAFTRALARARVLDGACGAAWIEHGVVTRAPMLFRVEAGAFVPAEY